MYGHRIMAVLVLCLTSSPGTAQPTGPSSPLTTHDSPLTTHPSPPATSYKIEKERLDEGGGSADRIYLVRRPDAQGKSTLYVTVQFRITDASGQPAFDVKPDEIVVKEDGQQVTRLEIHSPAALEPLTTVLAIDTSGSMAEHGKMDEAKQAARLFVDRLEGKAECGLILFDHLLRVQERPGDDLKKLRAAIDGARPGGGTAYLDATSQAIGMLHGVKGRRAVLVMTDGVDLNSQRSLEEVIGQARATEVPIYTIGVGEPGQNTPVTTVLVLDKSGSMDEPAEENDRITKMQALHRAAGRFVDIMRHGSRTTLLPFSDRVATPKPFSGDKASLKETIRRLQAGGQTALFDAAYKAVQLLEAERREGKRAVVVLTDGKDNHSRHSARAVIEAARAAQVPLHMLGLGLAGELDEKVMRLMAEQTGGTYHHARNERMLYEIFEDLAIQLHDDGVDEPALRRLAADSGGKYYPARELSQLRLIYQGLAHELQTTYTATFPSFRQDYDGTARDIDISVWRQGVQLSDVLYGGYNVPGVVVPDMDQRVYFVLLALLAGLLLLPAGLRRLGHRRAEG
jgi:VWFA-related protein